MNLIIATALFLAFFILNSTLADDNSTDEFNPCHQLQNENAKKLQVRCIGMLRTRLLLITVDNLVYDLPLSSLGTAIDALYINSTAPVLLEKKWPSLVSSGDYQRADANFYNCFTAQDQDSEYLLYTTKWETCNCVGATYDLVRSITYSGLAYHGQDDQVLISSSELSNFFAINKHGSAGLQIMRFHFTKDTITSSEIYPDTTNAFYSLCRVDGNRIKIAGVGESCPAGHEPLDWPVLKGFIADGKFYLFGPDYVFTFPSQVYEQPNQPVAFKSIPYDQFVQCAGSVPIKNSVIEGRNASPSSNLALIIVISLIVLILLLCLLLCLLRAARKRNNDSKKKKQQSKESGKSCGKKGGGGRSASREGDKRSTTRSHKSGAGAGLLDFLPQALGGGGEGTDSKESGQAGASKHKPRTPSRSSTQTTHPRRSHSRNSQSRRNNSQGKRKANSLSRKVEKDGSNTRVTSAGNLTLHQQAQHNAGSRNTATGTARSGDLGKKPKKKQKGSAGFSARSTNRSKLHK